MNSVLNFWANNRSERAILAALLVEIDEYPMKYDKVTHMAVNQARRVWFGCGMPEESGPLLSTSPSHRSFIILAEMNGFFEFRKPPGVVRSLCFETMARVERS